MKGLLRDDYYAVRSNAKALAGFMLLLGAFVAAVISQSLLMGYVLLGMVGFSMNSLVSLRKQSAGKWNKYKLTTPIKRSEIVKSHFVSLIIWLIAGTAVSALVLAFSVMLHGFPFDRGTDVLSLFAAGLGASLFMGAVFFPLLYLGGEERSEVFLMISLFCGIAVVMGLTTLVNVMFPEVTPVQIMLNKLAVLGCAFLAFISSYPLTVRIFMKKEY